MYTEVVIWILLVVLLMRVNGLNHYLNITWYKRPSYDIIVKQVKFVNFWIGNTIFRDLSVYESILLQYDVFNSCYYNLNISKILMHLIMLYVVEIDMREGSK